MKRKKRDWAISRSLRRLWTKDSLLCVLADLALLVLLAVLLSVAILLIGKHLQNFVDLAPRVMSLQQAVLNSPDRLVVSKEEISDVRNSLDSIIRNVSAISLLALALVIIISSVFKGFIWSRIAGQEFNQSFVKKFLVMFGSWCIIWSLVLAATIFMVKIPLNAYVFLVGVLVMQYMTLVLCSSFMSNKPAAETMKTLLKKVFRKSLLNYVLILVVAALIINILGFAIAGGAGWVLVILFLAILAWAQWSRLYFYEAVSRT